MAKIPPWLRGSALVTIALAMLGVLLASVDLAEVAELVSSVSLGWLVVLTVLSLSAWAVLPTWRWHAILGQMGHRVSFGRLMVARIGAQPLKIIIPFRGGEAFRALWLRSAVGVPLLRGLASILFDLFLVALSQAVFLGVGIAILGESAGVQVVPALLLIGLVVTLAARPLHEFGLSVLARFRPAFAARVEPLVHGFLRFPMHTKLRLLGLALLVELGECCSLVACFRLVGVEVPLASVFALLPLVVGATLLPVTIGGFGTRELAIVWLFREWGSKESLTGAALLFATIEFVLPALIGLAFTGRFNREMALEPPETTPE